MALVEVSSVSFSYGAERVVSGATFAIEGGEVVAIMGPSGCGKSTVLRLIAGLETPSSGEITSAGASAESRRDFLRFLFQDYDAYPWFTVWQNVQLGSGSKPYPPDDAVAEILSQVGLSEHRHSYPGELSGGMRKRLALARCMVRRPSMLLLDEPFSSLDVDAKHAMYELVQRLWRERGSSVVMVTHELHEAILLADRVVVATPLPFAVRKIVSVPFLRPRGENITVRPEYMEIRSHLTSLLRSSFAEKRDDHS